MKSIQLWLKKSCTKDNLIVIGIAAMIFIVTSLQSQAWGANCIELNSCVASNPMEYVLVGLVTTFGQPIYIVFWGIIIGGVLVATRSAMITSLTGLILAIGLHGSSAFVGNEIAFRYGWVLIAISSACTAYVLIFHRSKNP